MLFIIFFLIVVLILYLSTSIFWHSRDNYEGIKYSVNFDADYIHFGYWDHNTRTFYDAQENINKIVLTNLSKFIPIKNNDILDIGCGTGGFIRYLDKGYKDNQFNITGIDINKNHIKQAQEKNKNPKIKFICKDFKDYDSSKLFDLVFLIESGFHFDRNILMTKINKMLNKNGIVAVFDIVSTSKLLNSDKKDTYNKIIQETIGPFPDFLKTNSYDNKNFNILYYKDITHNTINSCSHILKYCEKKIQRGIKLLEYLLINGYVKCVILFFQKHK